MKVSILTPIYNEEESIPDLVDRIGKAMDVWCAQRPGSDWEHLACDDRSTDGSFELLLKLAEARSRLRPLQNPSRGGQTGGFDTGFRHAAGDVVVTMDADLQVLPEDLPLLLESIENGRAELVNAVRAGRRHNLLLRATSRLGNLAMRALFRVPVRDAASNYTAIVARYVKDLPLRPNDHRYLIPILQRRGLRRIAEVEVRHQARSRGKAKYGVLKGIRGLPEMIHAYFRIRSGFYDWPDGSKAAGQGSALADGP